MAIRLHFSSPNYDFEKYNGEIRCSHDSFMKRNDRYFFHKLAKRYNRPEYQDFLVSNFAVEDSVNPKWLTGDAAEDNYKEWTKIQQSISRVFDQDLKTCIEYHKPFGGLFKCETKTHPPIVKLLLQKKISIVSAIILDSYLNWIEFTNHEVDEEWVWPKLQSTLHNCQSFIKFDRDKCKVILKNRVENAIQMT
ncbi:MAG: hypothetical protein QGH83_06180 [Candidatus Pacebacteria bacterium]|nr:hypothetical protein [Candidatus Paceibacterota bacterium]